MTITHYWWCLIIAILFGVLGTVSMKLSHISQKWLPWLYLLVFYTISFVAMTLAIRGLDISLVYAIWSGIGTIFVAIIGFFLFGEKFSIRKTLSLFLIVVGVIGIHLANATH